MPKTYNGLDRMAETMRKLAAQDDYRRANGIFGIPAGECEGCCTGKTTDEEGVCHHCRRLGWQPGDVNR